MSVPTSNEFTQPSFQPVRGRWEESDYLSIGTNHMIEFDNGFIEVLPMPTFLHQLIVRFLFKALEGYVAAHAKGEVLFAPLPVQLWTSKYREPDIIYLAPERARGVRGQPNGADLVMEVVSEGAANRERDLKEKPEEYARAGIAEYWIVDPEEHRIIVLTLDGQAYRTHGEFGRRAIATSALFPGFSVSVDAVFAAGEGTQT